jgi:hypothetical protein
MGVQLTREINYAAWLPHANRLLTEASLPALPSSLNGEETDGADVLNDSTVTV